MDGQGRGNFRGERTVCPFCSCGCGLYLTGSSRGIDGVGPSARHPVSGGRLCARGWSAHEATQWGPRLRSPLVRRGGELRPATWEEAGSEAVAGLRRLAGAGRGVGVVAAGRLTNEESYLAVALSRFGLRTPHVDAGLRAPWAALLEGLGGASAPTGGTALAGIEGSELVVLLDDDLAVTHPRVALAVLRAVRRGGRLIVVGLQRTPLSELAALHVPLDAGDPLATLAGLDALPEVGEWFSSARRSSFILSPFTAGIGMLRAAAAELSALAARLVREGRPAPLVVPLPIRANTRGSLDMGVAPDRLAGHRPLDDPAARARLRAVWGGDACWDPGLGVDRQLGEVTGLVVVGEEVPSILAAPGPAQRELAALEHLVVVDSFLTATAQAAHVVLPMAAFGESEGTLTGLEGRIQPLRRFQAPPGEARAGWSILAELLEGLGCAYHPRSLEEIQGAIAASVPGYGAVGQPAPPGGWLVEASPEGERIGSGARDAAAAGDPHRGTGVPEGGRAGVAGAGSRPGATVRTGLVVRRQGAFDWGEDPLVRYSPTLRRDAASKLKRFPGGLVAMNARDAGALGVREGWALRLRTDHGEARVTVTVQASVEPGVVLVPFLFREPLAAVLGPEDVAAVEVQPA